MFVFIYIYIYICMYPRSQEAISNEVVRVKAIYQTYHVKGHFARRTVSSIGICITGRPPISCSSESSPFQPEITMGYRGSHAMDIHGQRVATKNIKCRSSNWCILTFINFSLRQNLKRQVNIVASVFSSGI